MSLAVASPSAEMEARWRSPEDLALEEALLASLERQPMCRDVKDAACGFLSPLCSAEMEVPWRSPEDLALEEAFLASLEEAEVLQANCLKDAVRASLLDTLQRCDPVEGALAPRHCDGNQPCYRSTVNVTCLKSHQMQKAWSEHERHVDIYRVEVPTRFHGHAIGSVRLKTQFGLHPVALEDDEGKISLYVDDNVVFTPGTLLWFGLMSSVNLHEFLGSTSIEALVKRGELPIVDVMPPIGWSNKTLSELDLRNEFGVDIIGIGNGNAVTYFPESNLRIVDRQAMWMSVVAATKYLEVRKHHRDNESGRLNRGSALGDRLT